MAVVDILGAYLSVDMDDKVQMVFRGTLAYMMVEANPVLYRPFLSYVVGHTVLYVGLKKALYGCIKMRYCSTRSSLEIWRHIGSK